VEGATVLWTQEEKVLIPFNTANQKSLLSTLMQ
jgi:hypothetical protein